MGVYDETKETAVVVPQQQYHMHGDGYDICERENGNKYVMMIKIAVVVPRIWKYC